MEEYNYTIIIPHKNIPKLLQRCLDSIPERPDVQVIVVDDNSDPTIVDFENFPGKDRKDTEIYLTKEGKGAGYARNVGLRHAKGKWLLFADADDYYCGSFIDIIDEYIDETCEILFYNVKSSDNGLTEKYNKYFNEKGNVDDIRLMWMPWNKVFAYEYVKRNNFHFDEIMVGNDAMFCLKANSKAEHIIIIKEILYCHTTDDINSITLRKRTFSRQLEYLKINILINQHLRENGKYCYTIPILSPKRLLWVYKKYGIKNAIKYIDFIHKNSSLIEEFYS